MIIKRNNPKNLIHIKQSVKNLKYILKHVEKEISQQFILR